MKLDPVNTHLVRLIGVQGLGSGLISLLAPGFLREEDKKSQLFTRLLVSKNKEAKARIKIMWLWL